MREGEVGTEIAPVIEAAFEERMLAERVDALLRRTCRRFASSPALSEKTLDALGETRTDLGSADLLS